MAIGDRGIARFDRRCVVEQPAYDTAYHPAADQRLGADARGEPRRRDPGSGQIGGEIERQAAAGHEGQSHHRAVGHTACQAVPDQQAVEEPPVADRRGPRDQDQQRYLGKLDHPGRQAHHTARDRPPRRCQQQCQHEQRDDQVEREGEVAQATIGERSSDQRGGGAENHDHRRLDQDRHRKGHAEGRQVVLRVVQAGDDRGHEGPLDGHHQPGPGHGQPEAEDARKRHGSCCGAHPRYSIGRAQTNCCPLEDR